MGRWLISVVLPETPAGDLGLRARASGHLLMLNYGYRVSV